MTGIEGHRVKSLNSKTSETFRQFRTQRKIILSGTPIQNDLREFHAMVVHVYLIATQALIAINRWTFATPGYLVLLSQRQGTKHLNIYR